MRMRLPDAALLLLALPARTAGQQGAEPAGSAECPCVNPWAAMAAGDARSCRSVVTHRGRHLGDNASSVCVPLDYGASCRAWDNASFNRECQTASGAIPESGVPQWCSSRWCYVDAAACTRPTDPSDLVASEGDVAVTSCTGTADDGSSTCDLDAGTDSTAECPAGCDTATADLVYSYETCGNLNSYTDDRHYAYLRGRHLRVSYPGDSGSGYTVLTKANGDKAGSVVDFMQQIAREGDFTYERVEVGQDSKDLFSSSFTACVHAVAINQTDICVGNFWVRPAISHLIRRSRPHVPSVCGR